MSQKYKCTKLITVLKACLHQENKAENLTSFCDYRGVLRSKWIAFFPVYVLLPKLNLFTNTTHILLQQCQRCCIKKTYFKCNLLGDQHVIKDNCSLNQQTQQTFLKSPLSVIENGKRKSNCMKNIPAWIPLECSVAEQRERLYSNLQL